MKKITFLFIACLLLQACSSKKEATKRLEILTSPAGDNSELPYLFTADNGQLYMSWVESKEEESMLYYSSLQDEEWSDKTLVSKGTNWFVNWADFPSIMKADEFMVAHWLQKRAEGTYYYDIRMSISTHGEEWSESFIPHKDGVSAEHGFVSMIPMKENTFFASWLDGRNTKPSQSMDHDMSHGAGAMTLRGGIFNEEGETIDEWELDNRVCDCCQTAAAMTNNGPIVIYRDRSEEEIRDMAITRWVDGEWTEPQIVFSNNWKIEGCPVNGPAIAARGDYVAIAWYSAVNGVPKIQLSVSEDAGSSFNMPITVNQGTNLGRLDLALLNNNDIVLSWTDAKNNESQIMLTHYSQKMERLEEIIAGSSSNDRNSGFPRITVLNNEVFVAYTAVSDQKEIQIRGVKFGE